MKSIITFIKNSIQVNISSMDGFFSFSLRDLFHFLILKVSITPKEIKPRLVFLLDLLVRG